MFSASNMSCDSKGSFLFRPPGCTLPPVRERKKNHIIINNSLSLTVCLSNLFLKIKEKQFLKTKRAD